MYGQFVMYKNALVYENSQSIIQVTFILTVQLQYTFV